MIHYDKLNKYLMNKLNLIIPLIKLIIMLI